MDDLKLSYKFNILDFIVIFSMLIIGGDLLSISVRGFTLRLVQLTLAFTVPILMLIKNYKVEPISYMLFIPLIVSHLFTVAVTENLSRTLMYSFWLVFSYFFTYCVFYNWGRITSIYRILDVYNKVFRFVGVLIILNSILILLNLEIGIFGFNLFRGIPRPSIWFYESGYLATYLMFYFGINLFLFIFSISEVHKKRARKELLWSILFLSITTSTTGFMGIGIGILLIGLLILMRVKLKVKILKHFMIIIGSVVLGYLLLLIFSPKIVNVFVDRIFLLIEDSGRAATLSGGRTLMYQQLWYDFLDHPLLGVGAGAYQDFAKISYPPTNVSLEILVTTGILGGVSFFTFLIYHLSLGSRLRGQQGQEKIILKAFSFALFLFFIILQTNQNYLRPYLWMHLGLIGGIYSNIRFKQYEK